MDVNKFVEKVYFSLLYSHGTSWLWNAIIYEMSIYEMFIYKMCNYEMYNIRLWNSFI